MNLSSINLLDELDSVSNIHALKRTDIDALMLECAKRASQLFKIERVNAWLFNKNKDSIISIGEYDVKTTSFSKNSIINESDCPNYFKFIKENRIVAIKNVYNNSVTAELSDSYLRPNNIISLLDIPLRMSGELIGILCLEKTGEKERIFTNEEQTFALGLGFLIASSLEARKRRAAQHELENLLLEKELLIKEINHRVKNNLSILISLLRLSKNKVAETKTTNFINDFEQRITAMLKIHELLNDTQVFTEVNISDYLKEIINEFKQSFKQPIIIDKINDLEKEMKSKEALHLGLIITEILLNATKHSDLSSENSTISISFDKENDNYILVIKLPKPWFDFNHHINEEKLGLSLIKDLTESIGIEATYPSIKNGSYKFIF